MSGNIIRIKEDEDLSRVDRKTHKKVYIVYKTRAVGIAGRDNPFRWYSRRHDDQSRVPTAVHLTRVCRQIYAEAATLAFSGTIFLLCSRDSKGDLVREWAASLRTAQKNAISDIAINSKNFATYINADAGSQLRKIFPALERLHLNANRVTMVCPSELRACDDLVRESAQLEMEKTKNEMQEKVNKRENDTVQLVWHEDMRPLYEIWNAA